MDPQRRSRRGLLRDGDRATSKAAFVFDSPDGADAKAVENWDGLSGTVGTRRDLSVSRSGRVVLATATGDVTTLLGSTGNGGQ